MASARGAARAFFRFGSAAKSVRINHQRRLITSSVPVILQVNTKKRFQDVSALPVNKYDLNGVGVITTTASAVFSTDSLQALADETSSDDVEEDSESGMERKWPSPITQVTRHTAFVGGYDMNLKELSDILSSKFGNVKSIFIPKQSADNIGDSESKYQYGFVDFETKQSLLAALQVAEFVHDGKSIEIKPRSKSRRQQELDRTLIINGLPNTITIDEVHDYFASIADVSMISLVIKPKQSKQHQIAAEIENIAFVVFAEESGPKLVLNENEHFLKEKLIQVSLPNMNTKQQRKDRSKKVFVEGIQGSVNEDMIKSHFDALSPTKAVVRLVDTLTGQYSDNALVELETAEGAIQVALEQFQKLDGCNIQVRRLGFFKE